MTFLIAQLLVCLLVSFLLGGAIGWLLKKWVVQREFLRIEDQHLDLLRAAEHEMHAARAEARAATQKLQEFTSHGVASGERATSFERKLREAEERIAHLVRDRDAEQARVRAHLSDLRESSAEVQVLREQLSTTLTTHVEEVEQLRLMLVEADQREKDLRGEVAQALARPAADPSMAAELDRIKDQLEQSQAALAIESVKHEELAVAHQELEAEWRELLEVHNASRFLIEAKSMDLAEARARIGSLESKLAETAQVAPLRAMGAAAGAGGSSVSGFPIPVAELPDPGLQHRRLFSGSQLTGTLEELLFEQRIEFLADGAVLAPSAEPLLHQVGDMIRCTPYVSIRIEAHTDAWGDPEANWELSLCRAHAVRDFLVGHGHPPHRFVCVGYGDTRPIDDNSSPEGRWRNRRVEFRVLPVH